MKMRPSHAAAVKDGPTQGLPGGLVLDPRKHGGRLMCVGIGRMKRPRRDCDAAPGERPTGRDPAPLIRNCGAAPTQKKRATRTVLLVDSLRVEEYRAIWTGTCGANGARTSVSDGICRQQSTMRAGTWSVPALWSTSQMAARKSRESGPTPFPMSSDCARPLATVDRAGLSGAPRMR
jgi:hypothetical protein